MRVNRRRLTGPHAPAGLGVVYLGALALTGCLPFGDSFDEWTDLQVTNDCDFAVRVTASAADEPATWAAERWTEVVPGSTANVGVAPDGSPLPPANYWAVPSDRLEAVPVKWTVEMTLDDTVPDADGYPVYTEVIPESVCRHLADATE